MSAFAYNEEISAIVVPDGSILTYAMFGEERRELANPQAASGGDWYVWCVRDEDDLARVVAAIRVDHIDGIVERLR